MDAKLRKRAPGHKWVFFVCGVLCIAAVGVSTHFFELARKERERRTAAENELKTLTSQLQLLKEKNRELAEQLREAKTIAEELAREREQVRLAAVEVPSETEPPATKPEPEKATTPPREKDVSFAEAAKAFPLKKLALTASKAKNVAEDGWRQFRTVLAGSVRSPEPQGEIVSTVRPKLSEAIKSLSLTGLTRAVAEAQRLASKAAGATRKLFSFEITTPTAAAPPQALPSPGSSRKLTATDEELRVELAEVRKEKRELEKQIAERTGRIPGSVDVGRVRITTGRRFSGKVLVVNRKHDFVVIDIGKNQGMEKGVVLIVHRGSEFIGKAQVIKVYEKMAAADLVMDWMQDEVQVSDGVKKF